MRFRLPYLALVLGVTSGCLFDTSKTVPFNAADTANDAAEGQDTGPGTPDVAPDLPSDDLGAPDLSSGGVCPNSPEPTGTPLCNPATQRGCGLTRVCDLLIVAPGPPPEFSLECRQRRAGELLGGQHGESCNESDPASCRPGNRCVRGTCRHYCQLSDGLGCAPEEACQPFFGDDISHFGLCVSACGDI